MEGADMRITAAIAAAITLCLSAATARAAGPKPGDVIDASNAEAVRNLVSPGVFYMVQHGMRMKIVAPTIIQLPPPYMEATEKYSGQVRLSPDHRSLEGYVAGRPFPLLDPNDPYIAIKLAWNKHYIPIETDDYDLRFFGCESAYIRPGSDPFVVDHIEVGHYAGYKTTGRTEVQPLPTDPDYLQTNRIFLFALYPVLAPQSARGEGLIRYRYGNPTRGDDSWTWSPGTRRLRRLDEAILSTSTGAQTFDPDHYAGFDPKIEQYDYKFLGEKVMLAPINSSHVPENPSSDTGGVGPSRENWENRHIYIVEATPRRATGEATGSLHGRTVMYMDSEIMFTPYVDSYDRTGQLWKNGIYFMTYRDRLVPEARVAIYPFPRVFVVSATNVDVQAGFGTGCYLPSAFTPERECWYINMGAVDRAFFTPEAMRNAAP
jgi:hypothetical protein